MKQDTESVEICEEIGVADDHLFSYGAKKNWWSRAGVPVKTARREKSADLILKFSTTSARNTI